MVHTSNFIPKSPSVFIFIVYRAYGDIINLQSVFCGVESLPVPTVAMLNGITLGAGLELALSCDYIIADSAFCSQIGFPEVKLGVLPGS